MKISDYIFMLIATGLILLFSPIGLLEDFQSTYLFNEEYWPITSFFKFAVLATSGQVLALRIKTGTYIRKGFGIIPHAIVWGLIGITIKIAFTVYSSGTPMFLQELLHLDGAVDSMTGGISITRIITAFSISTVMNLTFGPVMMTIYRIAHMHIANNGGTISGFFKLIKVGEIFKKINWSVQWGFVFKKTIPLFWIPAHTITFLLPSEYRIVFAALLSALLGIILTTANLRSAKKTE